MISSSVSRSISSMDTITLISSSRILVIILSFFPCKSLDSCSFFSFASFASVLPKAEIIVPAPGIMFAASNKSAYWSINSHAVSFFGFFNFIAAESCLKNCVISCLEFEHNHGLKRRITVLESLLSTVSNTIFSKDVFPLPHSP